MTIDLRQVIEGDGTSTGEGFTGAVILTFTLNLNFYEQIIAPSLDRAGCSNVLIIADPDGYAGAMAIGARSITGAGMRYVCTPITRKSRGVQHVKLLLMAGAKRGRLLIGSGNLTLHGYGRNLELFSRFEFDTAQPTAEDHYAFVQAWKLISQLQRDTQLPRAAQDQLDAIREKALWLSVEIAEPAGFRIWHNYTRSLWDQLQEWRRAQGLTKTLRSLQVISPYYDEDVGTLVQVADTLEPRGVELYVDPASTNLDGKRLGKAWKRQKRKLSLNSLIAKIKKRSRPLHAKAIIGVEDEGVWCISGSANLSQPGLAKSWSAGGNLEMVTFRWESNRKAFDYILEDKSIHVSAIIADEIVGAEKDPSERSVHLDNEVSLIELTAHGKTLKGQISDLPPGWERAGKLQFLRGRTELPVTITSSLSFGVELPVPIQGVEAARLELGTHSTAYRWIDQPEALARFGARAYHTQVRAKLETFGGAEKLFQELMDFLWERFDPQEFTENVGQERLARKHRYARDKERVANGPPPSPADKFITDEKLLEQISWGIGQQRPFDRSTWSLRDLISLALLRLTTPTQPPEILTEAGKIDEEADQQRTADREKERANALENLCNYVLRYCKRYGERLTDAQFVKKTNLQLLFHNHFTLGRILLEFSEKVDLFTTEDLKTCFWRVWSPLVYPSIVGYESDSMLKMLRAQNTTDSISQAWHESGLPSLSVLIMNRSLGTPSGLHDSSRDLERIQMFMVAREFITRTKSGLGEGAFEIDRDSLAEAQGIRSISDLMILPDDDLSDQMADLRKSFNALAEYLPPTERRYAPLRELQTLDRDGQGQSARADEIVQWYRKHELEKYLEFRGSRVPILPLKWNSEYCPKCFLRLTKVNLNQLGDGMLVLCSASKDTLIYWRPQLPKSIL